MATQFSGNDKANLLSTALSADSGDNVAITSTSDAVATGGAEKDTIVLGVPVDSFTATGGADVDSILISGTAASSDFQGNAGDDILRSTGAFGTSALKGGTGNDSIFVSGSLSSSSVYGGTGNDSVTFSASSQQIDKTLFQSGSGTNHWNITSHKFETSTLQGRSGI